MWPSFVLGKNPIVVNIFIQTTGTAYPSGAPLVFSGVRVTRSLVLCLYFVDRCLSFFFWPLCCLYFFDLRILITLWYLQTLLIQAPIFILNLVCHYIKLYTCNFFPVYTSYNKITEHSVGDRRDGRRDYSSMRIVYKTATPMSCNCFKTVLTSCFLSYFKLPFRVGCAKAALDFDRESKVSIFSYL